MHFEVLLTQGAQDDLESIIDFVCVHDTPAKADYLLDKLTGAVESLTTFPDRGSHPQELLELGIREYRQVFFKPYRVIYRVIDKRVYIHLIADGRRDMQSLLARRLLGS